MNDQSSSQGQTPSSPAAQAGELRRDRKSLREAARNEVRRPVMGRRAAPTAPDDQATAPDDQATAPEEQAASPEMAPAPPVSAVPTIQAQPATPQPATPHPEPRFSPAPPAVPEVPVSSYASSGQFSFDPSIPSASSAHEDDRGFSTLPSEQAAIEADPSRESSPFGELGFAELGIEIPAVTTTLTDEAPPSFTSDPDGTRPYVADPVSAQSASAQPFAVAPFEREQSSFGAERGDLRFRSATGEVPLSFEDDQTPTSAAPAAAPAEYSDTSTGMHPVLGVLNPIVPEAPREQQIFDRVALAAAVVIPPAGFVLGLIALRRGRERRGWASNLARAAVAVSVVMTVVFGIGAGLLWINGQRQAAADQDAAAVAATHEAIVAESAGFCAALAASPQVFASGDPDFGWPAFSGDDDAYFAEIGGYGALWQSLVAVAPASISEQVTSVSSRVDGIVSVADSLPNANRAGNVLDLTSKDDISTVGTFVADYCQ